MEGSSRYDPTYCCAGSFVKAASCHCGARKRIAARCAISCLDRTIRPLVRAPGTVLMKAEVNAVFFFETRYKGQRHPHYGRFLGLRERDRLVEITWLARVRAPRAMRRWSLLRTHSSRRGHHLRLSHAGFPDEETRNRHEQAWATVLAHLERQMGTSQKGS